jgi:predicted SAM-dependent methyltransferase
MKEVLHIGCGETPLPEWFGSVHETRLDIAPHVKPDIVADMAHIPDGLGPFDVVYSSHSLEHLYPHDGDSCLAGCLRVLKPDGKIVINVPDLEGLSPTDDVLYKCPGGEEVRAWDLFYGYRPALKDYPFMAHRTGFTSATLRTALERAGFERITVLRSPEESTTPHNLVAVAVKPL